MGVKISKENREAQLSALALADGYEFVGWVGEFEGNDTKAILFCNKHGKYQTRVADFVNRGSRCRKCRDDAYSTSRRQSVDDIETFIATSIKDTRWVFIGFVSGYRNQLSKMRLQCSLHGEWLCSLGNFKVGKRCNRCGVESARIKMTVPIDNAIAKLVDICSKRDGIEFLAFDGPYVGTMGKAIFKCSIHGEWIAEINAFQRGSGCPSCAIPGYRPALPGVLYALLSECGSMVKIGISNVPSQRQSVLARYTPFKFTVYRELPSTDGSIPRTLEKLFHDQFPSAGLTGFDGATEWRQMSPDVTTWLDLLQ
jgi:hypothetical protein